MNKQEILDDKGWKIISDLPSVQRNTIIEKLTSDIERKYNVTISYVNYTELSNISKECVTLAVVKDDKGVICVLTPNK